MVNLRWSHRGLTDAFEKFGHLLEAKVVVDKYSGQSLGFGFVTFDEKKAMDEAIEAMNGMDLDGRTIVVDRFTPQQGSVRNHEGGRDCDGGCGSNGGECFKCGRPGHFARECPSEGARGGRDDRHGGSGGSHCSAYQNGDRSSGRIRDS